MLGTVVVLKGLAEFAGLLLLGRGTVYLLSFGKHESNVIYLAFRFITRPLITAVRRITPAKVGDRQLPFVTFILLFWIWLFLTYTKFSILIDQVPA